MFSVYKRASPNKLRDINIAIAYHNTGRTLADVAREFNINIERVRHIHHGLVRHIARCIGATNVYIYESKGNHSERMANYLQEYKDLLQGDGMKVEVTVNDLLGHEGIVLSTHDTEGGVFVRVCNDDFPEYHVEVAIEDLKAALRKLSVK